MNYTVIWRLHIRNFLKCLRNIRIMMVHLESWRVFWFEIKKEKNIIICMISLWQIRLIFHMNSRSFMQIVCGKNFWIGMISLKLWSFIHFIMIRSKEIWPWRKNLRRLLKLILRIILVMKSVLHGIGICLQKHLSMQKYKYTIPF